MARDDELAPRLSIGRPRNETTDHRILDAALELYGEVGWAGFNLSQVTKKAGVGKSSMYGRFSDRTQLLVEAFHTLIPMPGPVGDTVWDVLANEATYRLHLYLGKYSRAIRRLFVEMGSEEDVITEIYDYIYIKPHAKIRARLWEFKANGYIPRSVSVTRLLDAIEGSVLMRAFSIPPVDWSCFRDEIPAYVHNLVLDQVRAPARAPELKMMHSTS